MSLPNLSLNDIKQHCSMRSFERGMEYYQTGAIGNPVRYDHTLWADCDGTGETPYRLRVDLLPTSVAHATCSCPYRWDGYCKHIVALLLTYVLSSETITVVEAVLANLKTRSKSHIVAVLSELLKRCPQLVPVARYYADIPSIPLSTGTGRCATTPLAICLKQVDACFGDGFLEHSQIRPLLEKLTRLKNQAQELARQRELQLAQAVLVALIHKCTERYEDTPQSPEILRFVQQSADALAGVLLSAKQHSMLLDDQLMTLLDLSFDADGAFTPTLTHMVQQIAQASDLSAIERRVRKRLPQSPNRRAHIRLLLAVYARGNRIDDYLALARHEGESFQLIRKLFELQRFDEAWDTLDEYPLSADGYWCLLQIEAAREQRDFEKRLLTVAETVYPDAAMNLYQRLVETALVPRNRRNYHRARDYLVALKQCYTRQKYENLWTLYLNQFLEQHARKRALLEIIRDVIT